MHPVEILITLHRAQQAGAADPFGQTTEYCYYANNSCRGCPAELACRYITNIDDSINWQDNFNSYCSEYIDYTYEELLSSFPEYQL